MIINHPAHFLDDRFEPVQRSRQLIARILDLDNNEYRLWDLMCTLRPLPYKGTTTDIITATNEQLGQILGVSESTICRHRNNLAAKQVIEQLTLSSSRLLFGIERNVPVRLQGEVAKLREEIAVLQPSPEKKPITSNTSNKSNNITNRHVHTHLPHIRSRKEYEQIIIDGGYKLLTVEDMMWIDNQVFEDIVDNPYQL